MGGGGLLLFPRGVCCAELLLFPRCQVRLNHSHVRFVVAGEESRAAAREHHAHRLPRILSFWFKRVDSGPTTEASVGAADGSQAPEIDGGRHNGDGGSRRRTRSGALSTAGHQGESALGSQGSASQDGAGGDSGAGGGGGGRRTVPLRPMVCRICECVIPSNELEEHSMRCIIKNKCDIRQVSCDLLLQKLIETLAARPVFRADGGSAGGNGNGNDDDDDDDNDGFEVVSNIVVVQEIAEQGLALQYGEPNSVAACEALVARLEAYVASQRVRTRRYPRVGGWACGLCHDGHVPCFPAFFFFHLFC